MMKMAVDSPHVSWKLPVFVASGATIVLVSLLAYSAYGDILYIILVAPIVSLLMLVLLVLAAVRKRKGQCVSLLVTLVAFVAVSAALLMKADTLRDSVRWVIWSHRYKSEVLAQRPVNGQLQHIEWDGWGMAGQDTTVYLVFDPTDSLSATVTSHYSGKYKGLPCEVVWVHRLERHWYSVRFYTEEVWGQRNELDCSGLGQ